MNSKPISELEITKKLQDDDLILISRKAQSGTRMYGKSYQINIQNFASSLIGDFRNEVSNELYDLNLIVSYISTDLSNTMISVYENRLCLDYHQEKIDELSISLSSLSTDYFVKRQKGQKIGSITLPVYIKEDGFVETISSYDGHSYSTSKASCDWNNHDIIQTYLNKKTGGTIEGDLKMLVDGEEKSLSDLLKVAGSVKTVNLQHPGLNGNVEVYSDQIKLQSNNNKTIYQELNNLRVKLEGELNRLYTIV